jgi:hypothetical protein
MRGTMAAIMLVATATNALAWSYAQGSDAARRMAHLQFLERECASGDMIKQREAIVGPIIEHGTQFVIGAETKRLDDLVGMSSKQSVCLAIAKMNGVTLQK